MYLLKNNKMIELKISKGEYLTHEDLEKYLNEYEVYYREKFKEGIPKYEWEELIKEGNDTIEKSISNFDKIELIVNDIEYKENFYPKIFFPKPSGREYLDKGIETITKLRGEDIVLFSSFPFNEKEEYENLINDIYQIEFKEIKIKNPKTPPYLEGTYAKFSVPDLLFYKFDINKPNSIKKGDRIVFNLNILGERSDIGSKYLPSLTYIETNGIFSKLNYKTNLNTNSSSNSNCFVVTTTMGDVNHPVVVDFRNYRDEVLLNTILGRLLIKVYYQIGPTLSEIIKNNNTLFQISRSFILKLHKRIFKK